MSLARCDRSRFEEKEFHQHIHTKIIFTSSPSRLRLENENFLCENLWVSAKNFKLRNINFSRSIFFLRNSPSFHLCEGKFSLWWEKYATCSGMCKESKRSLFLLMIFKNNSQSVYISHSRSNHWIFLFFRLEKILCAILKKCDPMEMIQLGVIHQHIVNKVFMQNIHSSQIQKNSIHWFNDLFTRQYAEFKPVHILI